VAAVQLDASRPIDTAELERLVRDTLATYKQLRHVVAVDAIPRLPSGKVLRRTLRDELGPALLRDTAPD
jgi:acyl-coenzyme A synthetase/AMP-(fatty) acid ligase